MSLWGAECTLILYAQLDYSSHKRGFLIDDSVDSIVTNASENTVCSTEELATSKLPTEGRNVPQRRGTRLITGFDREGVHTTSTFLIYLNVVSSVIAQILPPLSILRWKRTTGGGYWLELGSFNGPWTKCMTLGDRYMPKIPDCWMTIRLLNCILF